MGGLLNFVPLYSVVEPLLALGFSSHVLVFWWGEKPCEAPRRPLPLGTSRLGEVVKSTRPRLQGPPISLVGWAGICRSGVTPFSSPLGLLLTHIFYFFWHSRVLLWFFGHGPMVCPCGMCPSGGV